MIAVFRAELAVTAGADDDELFIADRIGHRRGLGAGGKRAFPDHLAGFAGIFWKRENAEMILLMRSYYKQQFPV